MRVGCHGDIVYPVGCHGDMAYPLQAADSVWSHPQSHTPRAQVSRPDPTQLASEPQLPCTVSSLLEFITHAHRKNEITHEKVCLVNCSVYKMMFLMRTSHYFVHSVSMLTRVPFRGAGHSPPLNFSRPLE